MPPTESNCTSALHTAPVPGLNPAELIHVNAEITAEGISANAIRPRLHCLSGVYSIETVFAKNLKYGIDVCFGDE